jgi:hypothetical protein
MDGRTDICSSAIAPALLYYLPSMAVCNICISTIRGGHMSQGAMDGGATMPTDATRL